MGSSRRAFLKGALASGAVWAAPSVWSARAAAADPRSVGGVLCENEAFTPIGPGKYTVGACVEGTSCDAFPNGAKLDALCARKTMGKCEKHHDCSEGTRCIHYPKDFHGVRFGGSIPANPSPASCKKGYLYCLAEVQVLEGGEVQCACTCVLLSDAEPEH